MSGGLDQGLRQRMPALEVAGLTATARDQQCTLLVPEVCLFLREGRTDTTVWCHSNWQEHGKGVGLKAHDPYGCFGCAACHDWLDRGRDPARRETFMEAVLRTYYLLFKNKRLRVVS